MSSPPTLTVTHLQCKTPRINVCSLTWGSGYRCIYPAQDVGQSIRPSSAPVDEQRVIYGSKTDVLRWLSTEQDVKWLSKSSRDRYHLVQLARGALNLPSEGTLFLHLALITKMPSSRMSQTDTESLAVLFMLNPNNAPEGNFFDTTLRPSMVARFRTREELDSYVGRLVDTAGFGAARPTIPRLGCFRPSWAHILGVQQIKKHASGEPLADTNELMVDINAERRHEKGILHNDLSWFNVLIYPLAIDEKEGPGHVNEDSRKRRAKERRVVLVDFDQAITFEAECMERSKRI
ncbi:hypothetical protein FRB99_003801, partial [Tulasnella sp. 403]